VIRLRKLILGALKEQGFTLGPQSLRANVSTKIDIRKLHEVAVNHKRALAKPHLKPLEAALLERFARGSSVVPSRIQPRLIQVASDSEDERLFRYACLHWSIPVSSGYGRRLRFLVVDDQNEKLIGLIGLGDPVFSLSARDAWIGWDQETRCSKLRHVMDAFVLGALPPYSYLIGGKLVAMLVASDEIRAAFGRKYGGTTTLIENATFDGRLALITTTSALGKSSIYNRLRFHDRRLYHPVGWTQGSGDFHFANGLYAQMTDYVRENISPSAKKAEWGSGFRNRREVVKKCLSALDLPTRLIYHGVNRQMFVIPLAHNVPEFLRGEHSRLRWHATPVAQITEFFKNRWLLPRAAWDLRYREFDPAQVALWRD
jgi:hypothetical protein